MPTVSTSSVRLSFCKSARLLQSLLIGSSLPAKPKTRIFDCITMGTTKPHPPAPPTALQWRSPACPSAGTPRPCTLAVAVSFRRASHRRRRRRRLFLSPSCRSCFAPAVLLSLQPLLLWRGAARARPLQRLPRPSLRPARLPERSACARSDVTLRTHRSGCWPFSFRGASGDSRRPGGAGEKTRGKTERVRDGGRQI